MHHSQSQKTSKASPKGKKGAPSAAATKGKSTKATGSKPKKTEKVRLAPSSSCCFLFLLIYGGTACRMPSVRSQIHLSFLKYFNIDLFLFYFSSCGHRCLKGLVVIMRVHPWWWRSKVFFLSGSTTPMRSRRAKTKTNREGW